MDQSVEEEPKYDVTITREQMLYLLKVLEPLSETDGILDKILDVFDEARLVSGVEPDFIINEEDFESRIMLY